MTVSSEQSCLVVIISEMVLWLLFATVMPPIDMSVAPMWTCSENAYVVDEQDTSMSQHGPTVVTQVQAEPADIGLMGGPSPADCIAEHGNPKELEDFQPMTQHTQCDVAGVVEEAGAQSTTKPAPSKKRKRMAFANKKLMAARDSILLPEHMNHPKSNSQDGAHVVC